MLLLKWIYKQNSKLFLLAHNISLHTVTVVFVSGTRMILAHSDEIVFACAMYIHHQQAAICFGDCSQQDMSGHEQQSTHSSQKNTKQPFI